MAAPGNQVQSVAPSRSPIGIVSGGGSLPFAVAEAVARKDRRAVLFPLRGCATPERVAPYQHHWIGLGQINRLTRLARREGCRDLVFIGSVVRPTLGQLRMDLGAFALLPGFARMFRGGDNHLLAGVARLFEQRGFTVIGAHEIAPEILMPEGPIGSIAPSATDRIDIALGFALLRATGQFDVGQAVVVAGQRILAVEAAEGTDEMLARLAELHHRGRIRSAGGVLVKAPKPGQDRRMDMPTIGPHTVAGVARAGLSGIAVLAGENIVAEPEHVRQAAERERIFVVGMQEG